MNPGVNIISTSSRTKDENGNDHFTGVIDVNALKKTRRSEIEVVLVPLDSIPKILAKLMSRNDVSEDGLIMFAGEAEPNANNTKGRTVQ